MVQGAGPGFQMCGPFTGKTGSGASPPRALTPPAPRLAARCTLHHRVARPGPALPEGACVRLPRSKGTDGCPMAARRLHIDGFQTTDPSF